MERYIGIDIGGTKTAVVLGVVDGEEITVVSKKKFPTDKSGWEPNVKTILNSISEILSEQGIDSKDVRAAGVSCGSPLDSEKGLIQSPPHLALWDNVPICQLVEERFGIKTYLQNDANACALAEWKFGAGRGTKNMIFITCGTGFGAGLILDGRLYTGTNGNAGEIGHIRLTEYGPSGYGKLGSAEGYCSGSGIAQLGKTMVLQEFQNGRKVGFCSSLAEIDGLDAKIIGDAADAGDPVAQRIYGMSGHYLGKALSILIDLLNPESIVIGSIFERSGRWLWPEAQKVIAEEALPVSSGACRVLPAALGNSIGDIAALSIAVNHCTL